MNGIKTAMEYHEEALINKGRLEGLFESAINIKNSIGIEKALKLSNFTKEELINKKMNPTK